MSAIWSDEAKLARWLEVELADSVDAAGFARLPNVREAQAEGRRLIETEAAAERWERAAALMEPIVEALAITEAGQAQAARRWVQP